MDCQLVDLPHGAEGSLHEKISLNEGAGLQFRCQLWPQGTSDCQRSAGTISYGYDRPKHVRGGLPIRKHSTQSFPNIRKAGVHESLVERLAGFINLVANRGWHLITSVSYT